MFYMDLLCVHSVSFCLQRHMSHVLFKLSSDVCWRCDRAHYLDYKALFDYGLYMPRDNTLGTFTINTAGLKRLLAGDYDQAAGMKGRGAIEIIIETLHTLLLRICHSCIHTRTHQCAHTHTRTHTSTRRPTLPQPVHHLPL